PGQAAWSPRGAPKPNVRCWRMSRSLHRPPGDQPSGCFDPLVGGSHTATARNEHTESYICSLTLTKQRTVPTPYLLRGLVSCGICRLSCSGVTRTATDTRYRYYRRRGKLARVSSGGASCCPARFIPATQLDELVWADLCVVLRQPQLVAQALERAHSGAWGPGAVRRRP